MILIPGYNFTLIDALALLSLITLPTLSATFVEWGVLLLHKLLKAYANG